MVRLNLDDPRWDQSTFTGRAKFFFTTTNPLNVLASDAELDAAKLLVEQYKAGTEPAGTKDEDVWAAKHLYDSAFHPDTGEKNFILGRMAFQVPGNMAITGCMMTFYRSTPAVIFWQFMNQTFNSIVNYTNRNASTGVSTEQLGQAYVAASTMSVATAVGMNKFIASRPSLKGGLIGRFVPLMAVAAANWVNIPLMRQRELLDGITVETPEGEVIGKSKVAAQNAVLQVVPSRILMAVPGMLFPPLIMARLEKGALLKRSPMLAAPIMVVLTGGIPSFHCMSKMQCVVVPTRNAIANVLAEPEGSGICKVQYNTQDNATEWLPSHGIVRIIKSATLTNNSCVIVHLTPPPSGRLASNAKEIVAGNLVLSTQPFALVLAHANCLTYCHGCMKKLKGKIVQCATCERARYCNRVCMENHLLIHDAQCEALKQLSPSISPAHSDLVRLTLACIIMELALNNTRVLEDLTIYPLGTDEQKMYKNYAKFILRYLPPLDRPGWLDLKHVVGILIAIRFNAHPIMTDLHSPMLGLGLFPDAAKNLNHSCRPTLYPRFNLESNSLEFRAVETLSPGSILTYSYLDLFGFGLLQPTISRRNVLSSTFDFICNCSRCLEDFDDEHFIGISSSDQYLGQLEDKIRCKEWDNVIEMAAQLLLRWESHKLPMGYPLVYLMSMKIATAYEHLHKLDEAATARSNAQTAARICGFT
ncbi:sideroflexin-1 [Thraustotheca clavata]|uniref:Sideroflexin-1 n=1 Tax=Thraustotheca clavata TaxID=74557 RepID=A0A1W0A6X5_9STRA|nr:sideroflexin-1 [Thraustotheca clavata]